jgi:Tfp pilus assembly protein PilP
MRSVALILALFSLAVLVGCTSGPELEITSQSTSDTSVLFGDYVVHVQCRVRNTGGEGKVTVTAFVDAVNGSWRKHQNSLDLPPIALPLIISDLRPTEALA